MVKLPGDRPLIETLGVGSIRVVACMSSRDYYYCHHLAEIIPRDESHILSSTIKEGLHRGTEPPCIRYHLAWNSQHINAPSTHSLFFPLPRIPDSFLYITNSHDSRLHLITPPKQR